MSLLAFSEEEHARLLAAEDRSGNAFVNAYNVAILLSNLVLWPTRTIDLFFRFYSQVKKYHSLSIISSVRLHRVQAKMDLRYFLESTVHAGYALAHSQTTAYFDLNRQALGDAKEGDGSGPSLDRVGLSQPLRLHQGPEGRRSTARRPMQRRQQRA